MSSRRRESVSTVDRISDLPDSVICQILSLLPTKLAVATSILSKRWIPLWKSVTTFDFDDECFQDFGSFCHFVDSVIGSRDATLSIQSFSMRCSDHRDFIPNDVNRSVNIALQRPIENFELGLSQQKFHPSLPKLPPGVLSCRTLVVLKLKNLALYHIPNLVDLPVLKTLHLDRIYFVSHFVDVMNLFNGCPILEDLHTNNLRLNHDWHDSKEDFKGFPFLVRANVRDCVQNFPLAWFHNAKFMSVEISLRSLFGYRVPTFHNLTHMKLFFYSNSWHGKWNWVIQVLQHCPNLQNLTIKEASYYVPRAWGSVYEWKNPKTVPECLSSQLRTCSIRRFTGIECELQFVKYIMLNSKLLHTMTIKSRYGVDEKAKHQMLVKLSSYRKGSVTCTLLFD